MTAKEVIIAYAEALSRGDVPTAFSFFSEQIQWHQTGNNQFSGLKKGIDEIGKMIGGMMEVSKGTFALTPAGNLMANGNLVAMPLRLVERMVNGRWICRVLICLKWKREKL